MDLGLLLPPEIFDVDPVVVVGAADDVAVPVAVDNLAVDSLEGSLEEGIVDSLAEGNRAGNIPVAVVDSPDAGDTRAEDSPAVGGGNHVAVDNYFAASNLAVEDIHVAVVGNAVADEGNSAAEKTPAVHSRLMNRPKDHSVMMIHQKDCCRQ